MNNIERFAGYISERYTILQRRYEGKPKPWTQDKILQNYRFCNVFREDDVVTQWIAKNLRTPLDGGELLIPVMTVARFINRIDTLEAMKEVLVAKGWCGEAKKILKKVRAGGGPIITGAYMVKTPVGLDKVEGLDAILKPIQRFKFPMFFDSLAELHACLLSFDWVGGFMAGQIVADVKYSSNFMSTKDWWDFAASGPGSRRGLNYILDRDPEAGWNESEWYAEMVKLRVALLPYLIDAGIPPMHMQDLQNNCCEFSKYEKTRLGHGEPKQRYRGI